MQKRSTWCALLLGASAAVASCVSSSSDDGLRDSGADGSTASDAAAPPYPGADGSSSVDGGADAAPCPSGAATISCLTTRFMGPSLYSRFCSDLRDAGACTEATDPSGSGTGETRRVPSCPEDALLLGRCAVGAPCDNEAFRYSYALPGSPHATRDAAASACADGGGAWQDAVDGGGFAAPDGGAP